MAPIKAPGRVHYGIAVALGIFSLGGTAVAADGSPVPPAPEFTSPNIQPTFMDWLTAKPVALTRKLKATDPLQRPPFAGAPADSLKGMAAGIRGVQLDAPNRVKAAAYLGTVDCVTYPQAQAMLIATMQEDPSEDVRYEAVMSLRMMLSRGCSNLDTGCDCESCQVRKKAARETEKHSKKEQQALIRSVQGAAKRLAKKVAKDNEDAPRYDCCVGCCNAKVMNALSDVAYGKDEQCCWKEPSERVRNAAAEGLSLCATVSAAYAEPTPVPDVPPPDKPREVGPAEEKEVRPQRSPELVPPPSTSIIPRRTTAEPQLSQNSAPAPAAARQVALSRPAAGLTLPLVTGLKGYCVVGLKNRQFVQGNPAFSSTFEEHTYQFANAEAKVAFDHNPELYAPAYGGIDPVEWLEHQRLVEGQFLREYEGRFYLFASKENWDIFKSQPPRFVLNGDTARRYMVAR